MDKIPDKRPGKRSDVWHYFTELDGLDSIAKCQICKQNLSYKTSVTNLKKHIIRKHPSSNQTIQAVGNENQETTEDKIETSNQEESSQQDLTPEPTTEPVQQASPLPKSSCFFSLKRAAEEVRSAAAQKRKRAEQQCETLAQEQQLRLDLLLKEREVLQLQADYWREKLECARLEKMKLKVELNV